MIKRNYSQLHLLRVRSKHLTCLVEFSYIRTYYMHTPINTDVWPLAVAKCGVTHMSKDVERCISLVRYCLYYSCSNA